VHADAGVGGARPARHETHPGPAAQLALRLGHEGRAAFLAAGDEADLLTVLMEAVQRGQVTLPGHAEAGVDALGDQRLHEGMAGQSRGALRGGRTDG